MLLIISGLETAISQRTLILKLLTLSDTTFCHFSGILELSLICSALLSLYLICHEIVIFSLWNVFYICPSVHFYYYHYESSSLSDFNFFHLQSILTRLNFLKYCFHHINFYVRLYTGSLCLSQQVQIPLTSVFIN